MAVSFSNPYVSALQTFYNDVGTKYDSMGSFHSDGAKAIVEAAASSIKEGSYVLDLASGTGNVALVAASKVGAQGRVLGIDISDTFLSQAAEKAQKTGLGNIASFSHQDVTDLRLPEEFAGKKFDAVTCGSAIAMFPDTKEVVRIAAKDILKPGGVFVADMNAGNIPARVFLDAAMSKGFKPPFDPAWLEDVEGSLRGIFEGSAFEITDMIAKENIAGKKEWNFVTTDKLEAVWSNLVDYQSWVSFGVKDQLSPDVLEQAKQDWMQKLRAMSDENGIVTGGMKQFIVVATLQSN